HKFDPIRQSDYYRIQAFFAGVHDKDISKASAEEQAAWKAKVEPLENEIRQLRSALKKAKDDERFALEKKLEEAQERMPEPLPSLFSVSDDVEKKSAIHLLSRGDYQHRGDRVGMRPLGVLLPEGTPELPENAPKPRVELAKWVTDPENA